MGVHKGMELSNHKGMKKNKIEWNIFKGNKWKRNEQNGIK